MTREFFGEDILLSGETARALYREVRDLPIIDYHCHLDPHAIAADAGFGDIGQFWLEADHYKWRAMRQCGVDEYYITGGADSREKFLRYAEILPQLCGNPLYYWTHMELRRIFGIAEPLNADSAHRIYDEASEQLQRMSVRRLLADFGVEYIATTDDPIDDLHDHGRFGALTVAPTFRPDRALSLDDDYLAELGSAAGCDISTLDGFLAVLVRRLDYFTAHGCRIADHGFADFPRRMATREEAARLYAARDRLDDDGRDSLFGFLLGWLMRAYAARGMTVQLHFGVQRNVNPAAFTAIGRDSGFDVMREPTDPRGLIAFLASIPDAERPSILLYPLNDGALPAVACAAGAFRGVRVGAAWWFNDTLLGIRRNLQAVAEYGVLGQAPGMLTDSRSFSSYARFDFFRRILADLVGAYVDRGEYDAASAAELMRDICYRHAGEMTACPEYLKKEAM